MSIKKIVSIYLSLKLESNKINKNTLTLYQTHKNIMSKRKCIPICLIIHSLLGKYNAKVLIKIITERTQKSYITDLRAKFEVCNIPILSKLVFVMFLDYTLYIWECILHLFVKDYFWWLCFYVIKTKEKSYWKKYFVYSSCNLSLRIIFPNYIKYF